MANDAQVSLVGIVLQDPQNRQVNNSTVLSMKVAVTTTKKQANSQYPASDIYDVAVWGKAGESLMGKVKAKTRVWVTGSQMIGEPWKDRNGETHLSIQVTANNVKILSNGNFTNNNTDSQNATEKVEEPPF